MRSASIWRTTRAQRRSAGQVGHHSTRLLHDQIARGDVLKLIAHIRAQVHKRTGLWMESEVRYVSPEGDIRPASEAAQQQ